MSSDTALGTTALGVVAHAAGDLRVERIAVRSPAPDEALVRVGYGGVCGSDLHYWRHGAAGESILRAPMLLGHEIVGTVLVPAADGSGPGAGTQVAVHPATPGPGDGSRYPPDRPNISPGCTYLGSAARYPHTDGGFASQVVLPARMLRPLPAGLPLRRAVLAEPAAVAWHAIARAGDVAGKTAMVVGCGPIGALAVGVLKRAGAAEIVAVDVHDKPLAIASAVGATRTLGAGGVDGTGPDVIGAVDADIVIECSGNPRGLATAVRAAARGGRVVMVGLLPPGEQPALISLAIAKELDLVGSFRFNDEIDAVLSALADGSLAVDPVVTHEFPATDALAAFAVAQDASQSGKVLLDFS